MSAHRVLYDVGLSWQLGFNQIETPTVGGTFNQRDIGFGVATVGAGTYKLPDNGLPIFVRATGAVTLQTQSSTTVASALTNEVALCLPTSTGWTAVVLTAAAQNPTRSAGAALLDDFLIGGYDFAALGLDSSTNTVGDLIDAFAAGFFYSANAFVDIPLGAFRETSSGDVGNAAANGGLLASDTTPILEGAGSTNAQRLNWATGNVDPVTAAIALPPDFDGTAAARASLIVASAGTSNGWTNASGVITCWDGGANVADALTDTASTAVHACNATIAESDLPDSPLCVSVTVTPPTHATDALYLYGVRILYKRKLLAS